MLNLKYFLLKKYKLLFKVKYPLNLNQSKFTDYQWNLTDSNSWKKVTMNQSHNSDYFSEN